MGPDAIILSAKENKKGFGMMGDSSVEVTAAVSENKLYNKQMAERKLDTQSKKRYVNAPARIQKEYIERSTQATFAEEAIEQADIAAAAAVTAQTALNKAAASRRPVTATRYADIDENQEATQTVHAAPAPKPMVVSATVSQVEAPRPGISSAAQEKISTLQTEIHHLRSMLERFQKVPQNFVTLHPGAEDGIPYELSFAMKRLLDSGVASTNAIEILKVANEILPAEQKKKKALVDGWIIKYFLDHLQVVEKPFKSKYHVFLGPTGQGKTSTVVKMACHLMMREKKRIAILSGDHVKVGASDQLKIYAQILNVPCGHLSKTTDWQAVDKALQNVDYVLLDTPGVNLRAPEDMASLRQVLPPNMQGMNVHYVQSALARDADAFEVADRFKAIGFDDVIFTRLDEAVQHGIIYNFQKQFHVPLHSFGIGNAIPEDYEVATKERVVDLIFHLSKLRKERGAS
jgi:flagellar biosynthesis protein FlhF